MSNLEKLALALFLGVNGLTSQLSCGSGEKAAEIAADTIMNIHDSWEIENKREEALKQGRDSITLSGYTIKLK